MATEITNLFVQNLRAEDVSTSAPPDGIRQRALYIGCMSFIVAGHAHTPESLRVEAAALTALANCATDLAHWCENIAGDIEQQAQVAS